MKKIIFSDYDQTFYVSDEDIEKNKIAVKEFKSKGNIFVIATGRSYLDFNKKLNQYNFDYDYVILNHGATILDKNDNAFCNFSIKNEVIKSIKNDLNLEKSISSFCCSFLESRVDFEHKDLTKINVKYNTKEEAIYVNDVINNKYSKFVNSYVISSNSVEIISSEINKSKAIELLLNKLNLKNEDIYTIGDGYSDIEMVRDYNGYAMKESVNELKDVAKGEVESVSDLIYEILQADKV